MLHRFIDTTQERVARSLAASKWRYAEVELRGYETTRGLMPSFIEVYRWLGKLCDGCFIFQNDLPESGQVLIFFASLVEISNGLRIDANTETLMSFAYDKQSFSSVRHCINEHLLSLFGMDFGYFKIWRHQTTRDCFDVSKPRWWISNGGRRFLLLDIVNCKSPVDLGLYSLNINEI